MDQVITIGPAYGIDVVLKRPLPDWWEDQISSGEEGEFCDQLRELFRFIMDNAPTTMRPGLCVVASVNGEFALEARVDEYYWSLRDKPVLVVICDRVEFVG